VYLGGGLGESGEGGGTYIHLCFSAACDPKAENGKRAMDREGEETKRGPTQVLHLYMVADMHSIFLRAAHAVSPSGVRILSTCKLRVQLKSAR